MALLDPAYDFPDTALVPKSQPNLRRVAEAAAEVGMHEATVWRYLEKGFLKRYYRTIGRRRTMVDMDELQGLLRNPPTELAPSPPKD